MDWHEAWSLESSPLRKQGHREPTRGAGGCGWLRRQGQTPQESKQSVCLARGSDLGSLHLHAYLAKGLQAGPWVSERHLVAPGRSQEMGPIGQGS